MSQLKPLRVPLPVIVLLSALILACGSTEETPGPYYPPDPEPAPYYPPAPTPDYTTPTYTSGPTLPSYIPELDKSKPPEYPKTADVTLLYTEPAIPDSSTFFQDLKTRHSVDSYRGSDEAYTNDYFSILGTTALLVAESQLRYNADGSSTRYAHGLAIVTFDTSKRSSFSGSTVSTSDPYCLGMGYMRDGNFHGPWFFNHTEHARQGTGGSKVQMIAEYQYGKANGECRWWDADGYFTQRAYYSDGQMHGTCTVWDDYTTNQWEYVHGSVYGTCMQWGADGSLEIRGQKYGSTWYGKYEYWDPDSSLRYVATYRDLGAVRGWVSVYDDTGKLYYQAWTENDIDEGPYIRYAPEGHKLWEGQRVGGVHHGLFKRFTADGFNDFDAEYVNGVQTGRVRWYYSSGKLWQDGQFVEGSYDGRLTTYREDGSVSEIADYQAGSRHGAHIQYDTAGQETLHDIYENGTLIRSELASQWPEPVQVHDEFGNEITRSWGRWHVETQKGAPGAITGTAMAWHGGLGGCVLFGGRSGSVLGQRVYGETWLRKDGKWQQVFKGDGPHAREDAAMAYDSRRDVIVLFGGNDKKGNLLSDTWELSSVGWRQISSSTQPAARTGARLAYDSARGLCVMFGGKGAEDAFGFTEILNATEEWDGSNWRKVEGLTPPPGVHGHAMAYDELRGVTVIHGGSGPDGASGETWCYDGKRWGLVDIYGAGPNWQHGMAYDRDAGRMVLVTKGSDERGDEGLLAYFPDSFWGFTSWSRIGRSQLGPRSGFAVAYDNDRGELVVWGGVSVTNMGDKPHRETLVLTDQTQEDISADAADFVERELASPGWTWIDNGSYASDPTDFASTVRDEGRDVTVRFGGWNDGRYQSETREFKDGNWTLMQPKDSPAARSHAMSWYDETRKSVMLMGGYGEPIVDGNVTQFGDLWEWNGKNWKRLRESFSDMPAQVHSWSYDSKRGVLVAWVSAVADEPRALFEFNGTSWKRTEAGEPAAGLTGGYWVFDPSSGKALLYGSYDATTYATDPRCWYWDGKYWEDAELNGTAQWGGLSYTLHADHAGKALWQPTPDGIRRLKDGVWQKWECPAVLSFWFGALWTDERGHVFFHGTNYDVATSRNDTLEFDPAAGKPKQ